MAKKKVSSWLPPAEETEQAAKKSITKTTPKKPKNKGGRPRAVEGETIKVLIPEYSRSILRRIAAMDDTTMIEVMERLINDEAAKKGLK